MKKTLVIGASTSPDRYAYKATSALNQRGHEVHLLGRKTGIVEGLSIETEPQKIKDVDTVTLYLNPQNQVEYIPYILSLAPKRVIFNPGTENEDFAQELKKNNIEALNACTLVLLSVGNY